MKITEFKGDYRWLSNFYPCDIEFDGLIFPSVENAYQAAKTQRQDMRKIFQKLTAGEAKRFARKMKIRSDWDDIKIQVMTDLNRMKYQHCFFKELLIGTGSHEIIEGNTWGDTFWGVCNGKGENHLGKILMQIRSEISERAE